MQTFNLSEVRAYYSVRVPKLKWVDVKELRCPCPVHGGTGLNFTVKTETGMGFCHSSCGKGWDILGLEMALSGRDFITSKAAVWEIMGRQKIAYSDRDIEATYDYTDSTGKLLYQVVRKAGKKFSQRRQGPDGKWIYGLADAKPVPFQLPLLRTASVCAVTEGEKDALSLTRAGIVATCNNGGAGNFKPELAAYFAGKDVMILPDNDEPGRKHAMAVARILAPVARSVRIVEIPGLPVKGDVGDYLQRSGTAESLMQLYVGATDWIEGWEYESAIPDENDKHLRNPAQLVEEMGGMDAFWSRSSLREGIPTPWHKLNQRLGGGLRGGEVYVLGANSGQGKTSLAMQFVWHALKNRHGVLVFSMEMTWIDVFQRMIAMQAKVDLTDFRALQKEAPTSPELADMRFRLQRYTWELTQLPLLVSNKTRVTPDYLLKESARLQKSKRISLVVVDHMQLMSASKSVRGDYEKFTDISRATKETAMALGAPVLLVSQTSRNNSHDKRVELEVSDLRGSGAIEEDAAAVMLLYDDKDDRENTKKQGTYNVGPVKTWLKLDKNRFGAGMCYMPLLHYKTHTRFEYMETNVEQMRHA